MESKVVIKLKTCLLFLVVFLQIISLSVFAYLTYMALACNENFWPKALPLMLIAIGTLLAIGIFYLISKFKKLTELEKKLLYSQLLLNKSQDLVSVLNKQGHDFRNHLQVILGLVQLGKFKEAEIYIKETNLKLRAEASSVSRVKNLETVALILAKEAEAKERKIAFEAELNTELIGLTVNPADFVRILGNLIDNALAAVDQFTEKEQRKVMVKFNEDKEKFVIQVINKLPLIPIEMQKRIFQQGFSTKGLGGSGLGLSIVEELTEANGGEIYLESTQDLGTVFSLVFPKTN